jgi:hypothetical protein
VDDAETRDDVDVSINIDGTDIVSSHTIRWGVLPDNTIHRGRGSLLMVPYGMEQPISFDSASLTNSSVRVGITGDNMWAPEHILLIGPEANSGRYIPLAIEWDINTRLSTDPGDTSDYSAKLTIPIRRVGLGSMTTVIRRVLFLVVTSQVDDAGSEDPIVLEITAGGNPVLNQEIPSEFGERFEKSHNWYTLDVLDPFNKRDVMANGGITLSIKGEDAWLPRHMYVFGLDTLNGRPSQIVPLVSVTESNLGWLSENLGEGQPYIPLPVN